MKSQVKLNENTIDYDYLMRSNVFLNRFFQIKIMYLFNDRDL